MKYLLILLLLLPLLNFGEVVSYGEDPFVLGMSIDAYALGNIRALPLANPSPGSNIAGFNAQDPKLGFQHTEGFGGIYQTDVLSGIYQSWSFLVFRGGVSGIPDTRQALLDYGTDGVAGTNDADGTEGNDQLDPGERLSINSITYFSTQQLLAEVGYSYALNPQLAIHGTVRLLTQDLFTQSGFGVGFHGGLLYVPLHNLRLGAEVTDLLTTTLFWSGGLTENFAPKLYLGADYQAGFEKVPFQLHPLLQLELPLAAKEAGLNQESWGYALGFELVFQDQLFIQLGRNAQDQFQVGAMIRTRYLDIHYGTGFSDLSRIAGQTHRVGVDLKLAELNLF